jgi:hypothetical protein
MLVWIVRNGLIAAVGLCVVVVLLNSCLFVDALFKSNAGLLQ